MADENDSRYEDILRRIEQRQREEANAPKQDDLASVLDAVNALGFLDELKEWRLGKINVYGPKTLRGLIQAGNSEGRSGRSPLQPWVGVAVWYKPKGYYHYQTLTLLGIWANYGEGESIYLTIGTKALEYTHPVYNAESYQLHIERRFDLHYNDDGSPPPESGRRYTVQYEKSKRLAIRAAIQGELEGWARESTGR